MEGLLEPDCSGAAWCVDVRPAGGVSLVGCTGGAGVGTKLDGSVSPIGGTFGGDILAWTVGAELRSCPD